MVPAETQAKRVVFPEGMVEFLCTSTGFSLSEVATVSAAQAIYWEAANHTSGKGEFSAAELKEITHVFEDLFVGDPETFADTFELESEFVTQYTEVPYRHVLTILLAKRAWEVRHGLAEQRSYETRRVWTEKQCLSQALVDICAQHITLEYLDNKAITPSSKQPPR